MIMEAEYDTNDWELRVSTLEAFLVIVNKMICV